jgi:hypothetical protein
MENRGASQVKSAGVHANQPAEKLLIQQFRCWMTGYATGKLAYFDVAWDSLSRKMRQNLAKQLFADFHCLARLLRGCNHREIEWMPVLCKTSLCKNICHDEGLFLILIHASQFHEAFTEVLAATELLGDHRVGHLLTHSRSIASALAAQRLYLQPIERVTSLKGALSKQPGCVLH